MKLAISALPLVVLAAGGCETPVPDEAGEALFNPMVLHQVAIEMDAAQWTKLQAKFESNIDYSAMVKIDGWEVPDVGIRSRGQGTRNPEKPGLKVIFNHFDDDRSFGRLTNLVLRSLYGDASCVREYLAFQVYAGMGIAAPRASFARVTVNGEYVGLYGVIEDIDEPFLTAHLHEHDGNLFKVEAQVEPWDFGPLPSYVPMPFEPESNQGAPDLETGLTAFIGTLSSAPDDELVDALAPYLDVLQFLQYVAAEEAIAHTDGLTSPLGPNNFYLYQPPGTTRFSFLPWDREFAFASVNHPIYFRVDTNVLTSRLLSIPQVRAEYREILRAGVDAFVTDAFLSTRLEAAYALIRPSVLEDPHKIYSDLGPDEANRRFESAVDDVRAVVHGRAASVAAQLAEDSTP